MSGNPNITVSVSILINFSFSLLIRVSEKFGPSDISRRLSLFGFSQELNFSYSPHFHEDRTRYALSFSRKKFRRQWRNVIPGALTNCSESLHGKTRFAGKRTEKRLNVHEAVIVTLQRFMDMIDPPVTPQAPNPRTGFTT